MAKETKEQALENVMAEIKKDFGAGAVRIMSDSKCAEPVEIISTRCKAIDEITGVGGVVRGRITEVYGPEGGGKTTFCLHLAAETQSQGGLVAYIDAEHALDVDYARAVGVDVDKILASQPDCGEDALQIALMLIRSGVVSLVIVDSVAALVPRAELDGDMGDAQMGLQARLMSQAMRKLNGEVKRTKTALVFVNQIRDKIGVMFGSPETTTGGRALKFYASLRFDLRRIKSIEKSSKIVGQEVQIKCVKNKLSTPYRKVTVPLMYGKGFINE